MENKRGLAWQHGTRIQGVQCISPAEIQFLPDNYPHAVPFKHVVDGCVMPAANPDLPWLIRRHRDDHVAFWETRREFGPHRIEDVEAGFLQTGRKDVLLIGAGWSAGENMALVRRWIGIKNPIVVAVNRASVCWPDADVFFITERQANPYWWRHSNPDAICLTAPSVNPKLLEHFKPPQYAYFGTPWCWHDKWPNAPEWALKPPLLCLPACETTMSMALAWTVRLQPERIILLGVDHCWPAYTVNYDNIWLPGPYYCDGYPWNGPEGVNRYVRRGINGRMVVCNQVHERQVTIFKKACEQIQINGAMPEPASIINGSGHGIVDFNEDNMLFMRECDESMAAETHVEGEQLVAARTAPAASAASAVYSEPLCPPGSYGSQGASQVPPVPFEVGVPAKAHWESGPKDVTAPEPHPASPTPTEPDPAFPPLSVGMFPGSQP